MRRAFLILLLAEAALPGATRWAGFSSGPFEVLTDAGERAAQERLASLEQFRFAMEQLLGKSDIRPVWPVRVLVLRSPPPSPAGLSLARDAYTGVVPDRGPVPPAILREIALILIQAGPRSLPAPLEMGLAEVFSTLATDGARISLGAPPPPEHRGPDWALMHMLTVTPGYYSGIRVLVRNLEAGVDEEPAWRNAFGKTLPQLREEAGARLKAGQFAAIAPHSRTIRPEKDFKPLALPANAEAVAIASLAMTGPDAAAARNAWQSVLKASPNSAEALEGLGLIALAGNQRSEAYDFLRRAVEAASTSARAWYEYGLLEPDRDKALAALEKASTLNPLWALPHSAMAGREADPGRRAALLAAAARLDPRNVGYWRALAEAQEAAGLHIEAAKTWASAEQAAAGSEERESLRQLRRQAEVRRQQQEAEARQQAARREAEELEQLKQKSIASIQAALDKAQRENPPAPSSGPVVPWWDGPQPDARIAGTLVQVDCLGKQARLVVQTPDKRTIRLLVAGADQIAVLGTGEKAFGCGPQKPPRAIRVEYFVKPDAKLGTDGEAAVLEFP